MLTIMFKPHLKKMKVIQDFMGNVLAIQIVVDYDINIVYSLLL
jgi:hypothetical protein